jgi:hypothetical protein
MPAAQRKRCAYPASRRSVPRGTEPTRTAGKFCAAPVNRDSEWLSWQPGAESRGRALFELHGGTLLLSQVRLRADESAAVDSLIHVRESAGAHRPRAAGASPMSDRLELPRRHQRPDYRRLLANLEWVPFTSLSRRIIMTNGASGSSHSREGAWRREHAASAAWHRRADHGNDVAASDGPAIRSSWQWVSRTPCLRASLGGRDRHWGWCRRLGVRGLAALLRHGRTEWDLLLRAPHSPHGARRICAHDGTPAAGS